MHVDTNKQGLQSIPYLYSRPVDPKLLQLAEHLDFMLMSMEHIEKLTFMPSF
jgi:hypothetical protein